MSDGQDLGRVDTPVGLSGEQKLAARADEAAQIPRITVVGKRSVAVVASLY